MSEREAISSGRETGLRPIPKFKRSISTMPGQNRLDIPHPCIGNTETAFGMKHINIVWLSGRTGIGILRRKGKEG